MTKSSSSEKRQDERLIQELRDFQRSHSSNKRCFDCNEMMPQYVCLDFNTFVCTACSGIHREFAHRIKSISMSKFTESEVKNMVKKGGNEAAQKYWRSKHDPSFRPTGGTDGERTRNFIRLTYIDRKWLHESPRHAKKEKVKQTAKSTKREKKANDANGSSSLKSVKPAGDSEFGDFSNFQGSSQTAAATFGDFSHFNSATTSPQNATEGFADFGNFNGSSSSSSTGHESAPKVDPSPPAPKFNSFKIAPPPGSSFSTSTVSSMPAMEDLMGVTSPKSTDVSASVLDAAPVCGNAIPSAPPASSPFDFNVPTPLNREENRSHRASRDPFSNMTAATPSASATQNSSPFDAFGGPSESTLSPFDAFATPAHDKVQGFGNFPHSTNSLVTDSASNLISDPFINTTGKAAPAAADPFAAFGSIQSSSVAAPTSGSGAFTPDFGPSIGFPWTNTGTQHQGVMNDPFGLGNGTGNTSGIPAVQPQPYYPARGSTKQPFGNFPQPQHAFGHIQQPMQWQGQQGFSAQHQRTHSTRPQYSGQVPPVQKTPAATTSVSDPFASLSIGNLGFGATSTCNMSTSSGGTTTMAPPIQSRTDNFSGNGSAIAGAPLTKAAIQNTTSFTDPNAFGDFASAPQTSQTPANPFDLF